MKVKKLLSISLAVIMLMCVVCVTASAASLNITRSDYGYMVPTDAKISKVVTVSKLYGNYDYMNFYIESNYDDVYYFFEIYSDKEMKKLVAGDFTYCATSGTYSYSPLVKLKGLKSGTYYAITYAARIDSAGNVTIADKSLLQFKVGIKRNASFSQQTVLLKSVTNTVNGPTIKWLKLSGEATKYAIYRRSMTGTKWTRVGIVNGSTLSFTDKSIKDKNGKYIYTVKALNKSGTASRYLYNGLSCLFAKTPKISSVATTSDNRIQVKWNNISNSAYYRVYRSENGGSWKLINSNYRGTTYYDTTAKNGKNYKYTVRAVIPTSNGNAVSYFYNVNKGVDFVSQPTLNPVEVAENGLKITWGKVTGAVNYTVYRKSFEIGDSWVNLGKVSADVTEFTDTTANENSAFIYTVRSEGKTSRGCYSGTGVEYIKLAEPEVTIEPTDTGARLEWDAINGALYYEIMKKNEDGSWSEYTTTSYCFFDYYSNKYETVSLSVRAARDDLIQSTFNQDLASITIYPEITVAVTVSKDYSDISWTNAGADSYNLYKKDPRKEYADFELIYSGTECNFRDNDVEYDVAYVYMAKGVWNGVEQNTRVMQRTYTKYTTSQCLNIKNSYQILCDNKPTAYFDGINSGYYFDIATTDYGEDKSILLYAVNKAGEYIYTGSSYGFLNDGSFEFLNDVPTFSFVVSDYNGSSVNEDYIVNVDIEKCEAVKPTYTTYGDGIKLTWNAVDNAEKYIVEKCEYNEFELEVEADGSAEYSVVIKNSQLEKWGVNTNFKITAIHENGNQTISYFWDEILFYANPKLLSAVAGDGSIKLIWDGTNYHTKQCYYIFRKAEGESSWTKIAQVKSTGMPDEFSYTDKTVSSGKKYTYTVRCYDPDKKMYSSYYDTKGITATAK